MQNDRYKENDFWEGIGQLVNKGKERLFDFGTVLRERYHNYVGMFIELLQLLFSKIITSFFVQRT